MQVGHIECFEGPEGVYYDYVDDQIWLLTNRQFTMLTHDGKVYSAYSYRTEAPGIYSENGIINKYSKMIRLGDL